MALYESVFIIRQDITSAEVDRIISDYTKIISENNGRVIKTEYWGIRSLAYEINNNKKGHYVLLGIECASLALQELECKMKLSEEIIRFLTMRVDAISNQPSPILREKNFDNEEVIDVTLNNKETL